MLINSPNISGSLTVTGNSVITGSLTVLGGINGAITGSATTASYVEYSNVANKPALVSGSSQITYSGLTGIPSGIVSGSSQVTYSGLTGIPAGIVSGSAQITGFGIFATTGSNQFNGNQAITGSLTTTGTIIAQTLNVQQVTSSIIYSSGSNIFGNSLGNTQQFTGSVSVTGSLAVGGVTNIGTRSGGNIRNLNIYGATNTNAIIKIDGADGNGYGAQIDFVSKQTGGTSNTWTLGTGINGGTNAFELYNGSSTSLSINLNGSVGIGVTSPSAELQVGKSSDVTIAMSNSSSVTSGARGSIAWYNSSVSSVATIRAAAVTDNVGTELQFFTRPAAGSLTQAMTLDANGRLGIGTTSQRGVLDISSGLRTGTLSGLFVGADSDTSAGTRTNNTRKIGMIASPHYENASSSVFGISMDNQVSNNFIYIGGGYSGYNAATAIAFSTGGTTTTETGTERMRISSDGNVGIGTNNPTHNLEIANAAGSVYQKMNADFGIGYFGMETADNSMRFVTAQETPIQFYTNNTERMRINSGGVVLINNTYASPYGVLNTYKLPVNSTYVDQIVVQGAGNYPSLRLGTYDQYDGVIATTGNDLRILSGLNVSSENHNIRFYTSFNGAGGAAENNERMRIEYDGRVGIGNTNPVTRLILGSYSGARLPYINGTGATFDAGGITVTSANSGNAAIGGGLDLTNNTYSVNAYSPIISFSSRSSSGDYNNSYAGIWGVLGGQGGDANWVVGALVFGTASSYGITEKMRITSAGNVGIGATSADEKLTIQSGNIKLYSFQNTANEYRYIGTEYSSGNGNNKAEIRFAIDGSDTNTRLTFHTAAGGGTLNERMRITSDNNILFNTTSSGTTNTSSFIFRSGTGAYSGVMVINHATTNNTGAGFIDCYYNTGYIGGIQQNGTSNVSFTTSSDYRLKQDLKDFNGLNLITNLKVYDFKWKTEDSRMHGVIAHELQEVIPYAVHGNKDEIKENGKIKVQVVDYSKLVPVLVKAIQELKAENDTLKSRIDTLEQA